MSYATIDFADSYFASQYNSAWGELAEDTKQTLLDNATLNIDSLQYKGKKVDKAQLGEFPRKFCDGSFSDEIRVAKACCEEAISIYENDGENPNIGDGSISSLGGFKVGDVQVDGASGSAGGTSGNNGYPELFSSKAMLLLKPYLISSTFRIVL